MALLRTRRQLVKDLRIGIRLLLPVDPGRDRIVETARLFNPHARVSLGRIEVDPRRQIHIVGPDPIDASVAAEAQTPGGMTVAYFAQYGARDAPVKLKRESTRHLGYQAMMLMYGMAVRLGGVAWPEPDELSEPLNVRVFTPNRVSPDDVLGILRPYAPDPRPYEDVWANSMKVLTWRDRGSGLEVEYWPPTAAYITVDAPASLGKWQHHRSQLTTVVIRVPQPAGHADPARARQAGAAALAVEHATDGICVDLFGFHVLQPEDLIVR